MTKCALCAKGHTLNYMRDPTIKINLYLHVQNK